MTLQMTPRRWLLGAGAGALLLTGGLAAGPLASLAQSTSDAQLTQDEAVQFAVAKYPGTSASDVSLDTEDGVVVYAVNLSNGMEIEVDGNNGAIVSSEASDGSQNDANEHEGADNADENGDTKNGVEASDNDQVENGNQTEDGDQEQTVPAGTIDDGQDLLPQASITLDAAITAAQNATDGDLGEVDLEYVNDVLVFNVDVGSHDVKVNAQDGTIVSVDSDD